MNVHKVMKKVDTDNLMFFTGTNKQTNRKCVFVLLNEAFPLTQTNMMASSHTQATSWEEKWLQFWRVFLHKTILNRWKRFLPPLNAGLLIGKVTHPARHISCHWDRWRSRLGRSRWWKNPVSKGFVFLKVRDLLEDDLSPHLILD